MSVTSVSTRDSTTIPWCTMAQRKWWRLGEVPQPKGSDGLGTVIGLASLRSVIDWVRGAGATVAALALGAVMVRAAIAKLGSREQTEADFASLGLVAAGRLAVVVPIGELAVAALLVVAPGWGGVVAAALLAAFTAVLVRVLRRPDGLVPSCACFGGSSRSPISWRHLARNGMLLALALVAAAFDGRFSPLFGFVLY